jgi:hypothetical protein
MRSWSLLVALSTNLTLAWSGDTAQNVLLHEVILLLSPELRLRGHQLSSRVARPPEIEQNAAL